MTYYIHFLNSLGFEIKVTEAIIKGTPVIAYAAGGIPHQIKHGVTGFLVKTGDIDKVADYLFQLIMKKNTELYDRLAEKCVRLSVGHEFFTVSFFYSIRRH